MHTRHYLSILGLLILSWLSPNSLQAFNPSKYATTSKLATGKWVKIKIPASGVYQLTQQEVTNMGFSSLANVRIYGSGGYMLSEVLDGKAVDDLVQVPVYRSDDKLCFYAQGPVRFSFEGVDTKPHFTRNINAYSTHGYYFVTEGGPDLIVSVDAGTTPTTGMQLSNSYDYFYHERELYTPSYSGKQLLGENIKEVKRFDYHLPGLCPQQPIAVQTCLAVHVSDISISFVQSILHPKGSSAKGDSAVFETRDARISYPSSAFVFYNTASPVAMVTPKTHNDYGQFEPAVLNRHGEIDWARLDYFILSYQHKNALSSGKNSQVRMGFANIKKTDRICIDNSTAGNLIVWNIDKEGTPVQYQYSTNVDAQGHNIATLCPGIEKQSSQFIAFDPQGELLKIAGHEDVANQNIHGMADPSMIILTNSTLKAQAERIAKFHERKDGMTVHVLDEQQVFNEFSSGAPDAMAVRLMNKMFYDRNPLKYKYFLMFGCGSFDNRGITTNKAHRIITFENTISNNEDHSYVSDDFFAMLDDNSGNDIPASSIRLGVGRIPSASPQEAKSDVDKLLNYINNPDYGVWRNNVMLTADQGDKNLHIFQAEGIANLLDTTLVTGMFADKAYVPMFPKASNLTEPGITEQNRTAIEARNHMIEMLKAGQYFSTYVGHAGATGFTKTSNMWKNSDVTSITYQHQPIATTACCDVARYDSDHRGIAETMFHARNGGAIALFTSSRQVYATNNDLLNNLFIKNLFSFNKTGKMPRLGDAYMIAKQPKNTGGLSDSEFNRNKMSFFLLGDPAMAINYPKPFIKIVKINNANVEHNQPTSTRALQTLTIEGEVRESDKKMIDKDFNGDVYVSLYDKAEKYLDVKYASITRTITYPRALLARVKARVNNGVFKINLTVPRHVQAQGATALLCAYAHQDNTEEMVNGRYEALTINPYSPAAITNPDNEAPAITSMYFNDESSFAEGETVSPNSTLYITATDNMAINSQTVSPGNAMTLILDGGKNNYQGVANFATIENSGKSMSLAMPMSNLEPGKHTITFSLCDATGNSASKTIAFIVGPTSKAQLDVEETPAIDQATFTIDHQLATTPNMTVKVTDASGKLLWSKTTSTFPLVWDLKDNSGKKLTPGLYKYFGTYEAGEEYGGTSIGNLIVIDNYKSNK